MATVKPFMAARPAKTFAKRLISPPYDVINREEAASTAKGNPFSFLHISRSEIDLPNQENPYDKSVYDAARKNLERFLKEGVMIRDQKPMFYIYRQVMNGRAQTGLAACVSIDEYRRNIIRKHELTRVDKEMDRISHFDVCNANTEPVFLTYREREDIRLLLEEQINSRPIEYDFTAVDGVRHKVWTIESDRVIKELEQMFASIPYLYIADGHHRSASAVKVGLKRRFEHPGYDGLENFNYFMAVLFPDKDLKIYDYNRVVKDLNGLGEDDFITLLSKNFNIEKKGINPLKPNKIHEFSMYLNKVWYSFTAKEQILSDDAISGLDVSILQDHVLSPILGIKDPRTDDRIDFVGGIRGLFELEKRVEKGMAVAFALYPVTIEDLIRVSDLGLSMPPKSTWFEPKLASGLFVHLLTQ